jgi:hypothetical protein
MGAPIFAWYTGQEVNCERREMYGVQSGLWGVLYRSVHFIALAGNAGWETGGRALYSPDVE